MIKDYPGERWKVIVFDFEHVRSNRLEVSSFGRIRSFNKISDGNALKGSMINGYRILKLRLFKQREEKVQNEIDYLQQQLYKMNKKLKSLEDNKEGEIEITATAALVDSVKKKLAQISKDDLKTRTIMQHFLFHRLVAAYFLAPHSEDRTIVAHIDYNKLNNRASNLKWMTPNENYIHQQKSPYVIKEKVERGGRKEDSKASKLDVIKVKLLKKMLNRGNTIRQLAKQFKVTDTQILRIKRGENWKDVKAAE